MNVLETMLTELQDRILKEPDPLRGAYELTPAASLPTHHFRIEEQCLKEYLPTSIHREKVLIDINTFYVCDISGLKESDYNSLVFQIDGSSFKSMEKTSQIMNRYFKDHVSYATIRHLGKAVNIHQKCPYVLGEIQFAPDKGPTQNQASWIGMHHVTHIEHHPMGSLLNITDHHELILNYPVRNVLVMAKQAFLLYYTQYKLQEEWKRLFDKFESAYSSPSVIKQMHMKEIHKPEIPSPITWHTQLIYSLSNNILNQVIKEGDPYLEEVRSTLSLIDEGDIDV